MRRTTLVISAIALAGALSATTAQAATATRTYVSASGNDNNACTFGAPCRTLQAAFNATSAGGEIIALDATGYGPLLITHSVSIIATEFGSISASANSTAISIQAQATDTIILRNLQINGDNAQGSVGISITGGHLILQDSTLKMLATGLSVSNTKVDIINSDIVGNSTGILTNGTGMDSLSPSQGPNTGITEVRIASGRILGNTTGWTMNNPGVGTSNTNKVTIFLYGTAATPIYGNGTYFTVTGSGSICSNTNVCVAWFGFSYNSGSTFQ